MFSISAKGVYGVSAVLELTLRFNSGAVQIRGIAEAQNIPRHYLEQILATLKRAGLVKSIRGAQGGYILAKPPREIFLLEVLIILEGPMEATLGSKGDNRLQGFWNRIRTGIQDSLNISLEELAEEVYTEKSKLDYVI